MGLNEAQKKERSVYLEQNLEITECSQRKPYVFISYASDNWETVFKSAVVPLQKQYGLRVYADKAFDKVNDKWIVPMLRNVRGADVIIAFVSQSYIESYACFLELLTAVNNRKQIVFVSLGDQLHLGDTTDQPVIERGVKNEILNQGANIATNTNNTSNDLMRAMKSAYTSISTLLEQDALSRYDIADAFINFFRDASINRKTIHDLVAVKGTIHSVSSKVFDRSLVARPAHTQSAENVKTQQQSADERWQPEPASDDRSPEQQRSASVPDDQRQEQRQPEPVPDYRKPEQQGGTESVYQEPVASMHRQEPETVPPHPAGGFAVKPKFDIRDKKFRVIVLAVAVCLLLLVFLIGGGTKNVKDKNYTSVYGATGKYTGEWKNNAPNGEGVMEWGNGDVYEGEWKDGLADGKGTCRWKDGDYYAGDFADGNCNGEGEMWYTNGDYYEGGWVNGFCSGQGSMTYENGDCYTGEWLNGQPNGQGNMTYIDGSAYSGEWKSGVKDGYGTYTWKDGKSYTGDWVSDSMCGNGTMSNLSGESYTGEWKNNRANGKGTMTYSDGTVLTGTWQDGNFVE